MKTSLPRNRFFSHLSFLNGSGGLRDIAAHRQHHGDGVFGGGDHISFRSVHDHNAPFAGGGDVHIVQADARPAQ